MPLKNILIEQMIMQALLNGQPPKMPGRIASQVLAVLSSITALAGLLFLMLALYHYFETVYSQEKTLVFMGGIMLLISIAGFFLAEFIAYYRRHALLKMAKKLFHSIGDVYEGAMSGLDTPIKEHPGPAIIIAALAGVFLGRKIS